ncbi:MAG: IS4 family transposase [Pseudomonadota bacterium]
MMHGVLDANQWASEVFGGCALGDQRRTRRLVKTGGMLASQVGSAPSRACGGDSAASEGAYRLVRNDAVEPEAIAEGGFMATARAASQCGELLALEDSTTLGYGHSAAAELGDLGGKEASARRGFIVHSVLLVDAQSGRTVGLVEQRRWCRASSARGQRHRRGQRGYEDKESAKWERASRRVAERLGPSMQRTISVCDRESDVYEYLRYKHEVEQRYVVRAAWDRRVHDAAHGHLFETLEAAPVLGEHVVELAQRGGSQGRSARQARLELRACTVELRAPKRDASLGALTVNAVLAREAQAPRGQAPASWLLLTSESIEGADAVRRVVRDYALRWRVEEFHKAWKSGAGVEQRRMHSADNLERVAVVLAFVAVRLLQLREALLDDTEPGGTERPCTEVLSRDEWRVLWITRHRNKPPHRAPTLRWAYESIAKLGGWTDTKRTGRAGWDTMWHGWFRFQERLDTYLAARELL